MAQTPASAGQLLQEIEKGRDAMRPKQAPPTIAPAPGPKEIASGISVTVKSFEFTGNTLMASSELAPIVEKYLNRPLSFAELQKVTTEVTNAYLQAGWFAGVFLPEQDIRDGIVTIEIVEAVFGGAVIVGKPSSRLRPGLAGAVIDAALPKGAHLNTSQLDRGILLLDDLPGVTATGALTPGSTGMETVLALKLSDEPIFMGNVGLDNTGSRGTGSSRVTGDFLINSPLQRGDQLGASVIHSEGSTFGRLMYSIPVGQGGWRMGASASTLDYKLITDEFKALNSKGSSSTLGLDASYPIIRSTLKNLSLRLAVDNKNFDNEANGGTTSQYTINNLSARLGGNWLDGYGGGGTNSAAVVLTQGNVELGRIDTSENSALNGSFSKLGYSLSRQQVLSGRVSLVAALSGQVANTNLDSAEKFYLGGANGVRAYPSGEGGGADGQVVNLELRTSLSPALVLTGFYDYGHVRVNHDNAANTSPNDVTLQGAGLSIGWIARQDMFLKATWAHRIGDNPNPTSTGNDQDGSKVSNRFWLQASMSF